MQLFLKRVRSAVGQHQVLRSKSPRLTSTVSARSGILRHQRGPAIKRVKNKNGVVIDFAAWLSARLQQLNLHFNNARTMTAVIHVALM
jgi:hypothetical protein